MKNVTLLAKFRRLIKSLAVSIVFLVSGIVSSSFTSGSSENDGIKKSGRDSANTGKNSFPGLFTNSSDPSRHHITQLNPAALRFVQTFVKQNADRLNRMKIWGKPYFDMYDGILFQHGLPAELKYVSVIESSLKPAALSPAGALGPWQIMPVEARRLGLKVTKRVDERKNFYKSTHAAAKFMKELHTQFQDWILVVAAYNCGPGRLRQAIRKSGSRDFWKLQSYLPLETRNHVKKFIATHYVFEGSGGLTTMTAAEMDEHNRNIASIKPNAAFTKEELNHTISIDINGKYNSKVLCENVGIDLATFNHFNPRFDKVISKGLSYSLRLPVVKMMKFETKKQEILNKSVELMLN